MLIRAPCDRYRERQRWVESVIDPDFEIEGRILLTRFEDLGHYPQIEDPSRVAAVLRAASAA